MSAWLAQQIGNRLLARLKLIKTKHDTIAILGNNLETSCSQYLQSTFKNIITTLPMHPANADCILINLGFLSSWFATVNNLARLHSHLATQGVLLFTTFGPNTLDITPEKNSLLCDMHLIGDSLIDAQFQDPVMDVEKLQIEYHQKSDLLDDLHYIPCVQEIVPKISMLRDNSLNHRWPKNLEFELIYGYAVAQHKAATIHTYMITEHA